jgi:hypothetical protein
LTSETTVFRHLRDNDYPAKSFDTGHPAYDRFLAGAKEWPPNYRPLDRPEAATRAAIVREMPFIAPIEAEPAESLGRAMLINAYAVPKLGAGWYQLPYELRQKMEFAQLVFYHFTRQLPHARLSAADADALLREIPGALFQDELVLFTELFFRSFPHPLPASLEDALNGFVDGFFLHFMLKHSPSPNAEEIIGRHLQFLAFLGRAPESLPVYRERARIFEIARRQAARILPELGPVHARYAAVTDNGRRGLQPEEARQFQAAADNASPSERGQMVADQCRLLTRPFQEEADRWQNAGLPFWPSKLTVPQLDLADQVKREMQLTSEQACTILEYTALYGASYVSNYPHLSYRLARTLSRYLPTVRPDLERLVKNMLGYATDQPTKELVLDALRGEERGFFERLLRRFLWKLFAPEDKPEMWAEWIADKRRTLLAQIDQTPPIGRAAPQSPQVPGWGRVNGQLHHIDVVGYAKRIARAQSGGADVSVALDDLRRLAAMARDNLAVLEASVGQVAVPPPLRTDGDDATAHPITSDAISPRPSLFGLQEPPTNAQLIDCERRTLAVLDGLVTRIELLRRFPDGVSFEHALRKPLEDEPYSVSDHIMRTFWIATRLEEAGMPYGAPDGLVERIAAINFDILDGPYLFDTEPNFTETEFAAWRVSICGLSFLPAATAIPALQQVVERCFAASLMPNHAAWSYAKRGYRAEDLGKTAIWALEALPEKAGMAIVSDLLSRAYPEWLRGYLRDSIQRIESRTERETRMKAIYDASLHGDVGPNNR